MPLHIVQGSCTQDAIENLIRSEAAVVVMKAAGGSCINISMHWRQRFLGKFRIPNNEATAGSNIPLD